MATRSAGSAAVAPTSSGCRMRDACGSPPKLIALHDPDRDGARKDPRRRGSSLDRLLERLKPVTADRDLAHGLRPSRSQTLSCPDRTGGFGGDTRTGSG